MTRRPSLRQSIAVGGAKRKSPRIAKPVGGKRDSGGQMLTTGFNTEPLPHRQRIASLAGLYSGVPVVWGIPNMPGVRFPHPRTSFQNFTLYCPSQL
jgi:hypothetical protein